MSQEKCYGLGQDQGNHQGYTERFCVEKDKEASDDIADHHGNIGLEGME